MLRQLFIFLFFVAASSFVIAQDSGLLTIDQIFGGSEFRTAGYGPTQWLDNGNAYTTLEYNSEKGGHDLIKFQCRGLNNEVLISADELKHPSENYTIRIESYDWNPSEDKLLLFTNSSRVWRANTKGDYWIFDLQSRELLQIGESLPESSLMFAKFNPSGDKVAYVSGFNLYVEDLLNHEIKQLTFDGDGNIINGTFDWVYEEEFSCRDGFRWCPDGRRIAFWQVDASDTKEFYMINNTDSIYSKIIPVQYPKVGEPPSAVKVGIVNLEGQQEWVDIPGHPRENYIPRIQWIDEQNLLLRQLNRKQNHLKIYTYRSKVELVYEEQNDSWVDIDHPDLTMGFVVTDLPTVDNNKSIIITSEKDGWRHLYKIDLESGQEVLLTPGEYDLARFYQVSGSKIFVNASPSNSTQRYLYQEDLEKPGSLKRLTPDHYAGVNRYNIAPNGQYAIHTHSSVQTPNTIYLISLPDHNIIDTLQDNAMLNEKIAMLNWPEIDFFQLEIEEGVILDGRLYKPTDFDPANKYPVIFNVYGEPWGRTATDSWSSLYNVLLAQQGYCVINIDNRGTPCLKGTEWRKSIYRKVGILNASDQSKAAEIIRKWEFIDENRIAVWGWSGGGSMTLNLLFQYPNIYQTGISVAPVSWQLAYDNIYQERYMGLPQENMEDFVNGSPLTYAENLKGNLLLIHGTADDNVHYQNAEMLINELVKHNKLFDLMSYPNRSHGIYEGANTRRHLYTLMNKYFLEKCPPGGISNILKP